MNQNIKIHVIFTSDVHGHLLPIEYSDNSRTDYGLSKIISAIKSYDKSNTIILDLGDILQGSPLMYFHQLNREKYPNPAAQLFNIINYDYFIPGNHDFNYGKDYLDDFINQISSKTLCQNIYKGKDLAFKNGYDILMTSQGVKVLIIGITTKYIPNWENPSNIEGLIFKDTVSETKKVVEKHKDEADLIICAYHGGFERDILTDESFVKDTGENQGYRIFKEIPEIDVLLTGHQHREIIQKKGNRIAIQPGANGMFLGSCDITFDKFKNIVNVEGKLLEAKLYEDDPKPKRILKDIESDNQIFLDEVIGEVVEGDLEVKDTFKARLEKHAIVDFINNIQLDATGAMLSATSLANQVSGLKKQITIRNVLSTYVYANTLVVVEISGLKLKKYLERCAEYFIVKDGSITYNPRFSYPKVEHYNYDMFAGIDYVFDLLKPFGNRVKSIKYKGKEIKDTDCFTLALNNYRANGGGDFEMLKNLPIVREIPFDVAELMIEYIRKQHYLHIKTRNNIKLLK